MPRCLQCDYDLQGVPARVDGVRICPECGSRYTLAHEIKRPVWPGWGTFLAQASIAPAICWLLILVLFGLGAIDPRLREIAYIITFIPLLLGAFAGIVLAGYYTGAPRPRRPHAILLLASAQAGVISIELAGLAVLWFLSV